MIHRACMCQSCTYVINHQKKSNFHFKIIFVVFKINFVALQDFFVALQDFFVVFYLEMVEFFLEVDIGILKLTIFILLDPKRLIFIPVVNLNVCLIIIQSVYCSNTSLLQIGTTPDYP